jgi:murein DD-endopeptidase MepM/ murein hydrolase activator NlpD
MLHRLGQIPRLTSRVAPDGGIVHNVLRYRTIQGRRAHVSSMWQTDPDSGLLPAGRANTGCPRRLPPGDRRSPTAGSLGATGTRQRLRWVAVFALTAALLLSGLVQPTRAAAGVRLPSPSRLPLAGPPDVVRGYDPPDQRWHAGHRGVDLAGTPGEPVYAAAAGTITYASRLAGRGVVVVDHGQTRTTYEPVTATVSVGDRVQMGSRIGRLDAGGHCSSGRTCLHWGLKRGDRYLDPMRLAPSPSTAAGNRHYRLLPASARKAVRRRIKHRQQQRSHGGVPGGGGTAGSAGSAGPAGAAGAAGSHGFSLPVNGPITSPFGQRFHPILHRWKLHDGTDFGAACGTPIRAPQAGTVVQQYLNVGYGNRLMLDHGVVDGKRVVSGFNHASSYVVGVGDRVHKGDIVGYVGQTGYATGCHLHLMVWLNGKLTNPMSWY